MIDRFRSATGALAPPASPGDRAGGTLDGVRAALDAGYFDRLGVTTLWLSPVYTNPTRSPRRPRRPPGRALPRLLARRSARRRSRARRRGRARRARRRRARARPARAPRRRAQPRLRDAPVVRRALARRRRRPRADRERRPSWFNDGPDHCVCGDPGCDWGAHMETCWFAPYLPDLNWRHPDVARRRHRRSRLVDVALRSRRPAHRRRADDAARRHPPHGRTPCAAMMFRGDADLYVVGEIFTGPGDGGRAEIRAYLGNALDGLDGAFDFPLMWAARDAVAHDAAGGFAMLEHEIAAGAHGLGRLGRDHRAHDRQPRHHALPLRGRRRRGRRSVDRAAAAADRRRRPIAGSSSRWR